MDLPADANQLGAAALGGALTWVCTWLLTWRKDTREATAAAVATLTETMDTLREDVERLHTELDVERKARRAAEDRVYKLREELHSLRGIMQRAGLSLPQPNAD